MSTTASEFECFASTCISPHGGHFVLNKKKLTDGKLVWTVSAKTLFDIVFCYIQTRKNHCSCSIELYQKCNWCRSISQMVYAASYFCFQNSYMEEIVTKFTKTFSMKNCVDCVYCARDKIVVIQPLETMKIENEEQREQYLSDYVFD